MVKSIEKTSSPALPSLPSGAPAPDGKEAGSVSKGDKGSFSKGSFKAGGAGNAEEEQSGEAEQSFGGVNHVEVRARATALCPPPRARLMRAASRLAPLTRARAHSRRGR